MEKYNINYFLQKLSKIDTKDWGTGHLENKCVLWHCGMKQYNQSTEESRALCKILTGDEGDTHKVWAINDTFGKKLYPYPTAKTRIIAALKEKLAKTEHSITIDSKLQENSLILN